MSWRSANSCSRTGAAKVIPALHIVRRLDWNKVREAEKHMQHDASITAPAPDRFVHVNQSYSSARLVRDNMLNKIEDRF